MADYTIIFVIIALGIYSGYYMEMLKVKNIVYDYTPKSNLPFTNKSFLQKPLVTVIVEKLRLGFRIDYHTPSHFMAGVLLTYFFSFEFMMIINLLWEIADGWIKPTTMPFQTNNKYIDFFIKNFLVSEGKSDVIDFLFMTFGGIIIVCMNVLFKTNFLNSF